MNCTNVRSWLRLLKKSRNIHFEPELPILRNRCFPKPLISLKSNSHWFREIGEFGSATDFFNSLGQERTLGSKRRGVCFAPESGRAYREFREPRVLGPLAAPKRTSETSSLEVCK